MKIAHIVNPVCVPKTSDLHVAQPVTFRSMFAAMRNAIDDVDVELITICYEEDAELTPDRFKQLPVLNRSVLDVAQFQKSRKLPLIADILDTALANSDAEYFIYSNVDISPMPYFYSAVAQSLSNNDALVINRRTISKCESGNQPLSFYYQQSGESHPGFDCFVFSRSQYKQFQLYDACVGANWIGRVLICNILAFSNRPKIIDDAHLTFHLGDDRSWKTVENIDYDQHNESQVGKLMFELNRRNLCTKHELLERSFQEFHLKTIDPDVTRPKATASELPKEKPEPSDFTCLPQDYLPSKSWEGNNQLVLRQDPVFVIGHPRSGTTLLQSLIATQLTTSIFPETHFFSIVRTFIKAASDRIQSAGLDKALSFIAEKLTVSEQFKTHILERVADQQLSPKMMFEAIVFDQLTQNLSAKEISMIRWMEKTPDHAEHLDVIHRFYPNGKFVFIVRNPEKAILSRRKHFSWNNESEWPISRHLERWQQTLAAADKFKQSHSDQIIYLRFEDLIDAKEVEVSKICRFLDIKFSPLALGDQRKFSEQQMASWETWKNDTKSTVSSTVAAGVTETLNNTDLAELHFSLKPYLERFGYHAHKRRSA